MEDKKYRYGQEGKKIVFQDSDKRHADLRIRLRHDGLTQTEFFRGIITGYLQRDARVIEYITDLKLSLAKQGKTRIRKTKSLIEKGEEIKSLYNLSDEERKELFDTIAEEFLDL